MADLVSFAETKASEINGMLFNNAGSQVLKYPKVTITISLEVNEYFKIRFLFKCIRLSFI